MPAPPLQAVTFDAAGTLIHLTESVGEAYSRVAARFGIHAAPDRLNLAFRTVWKRTPAPFSGNCPHQGVDDPEKQWWKSLVETVFAEAGAEPEKVRDRFTEFFEALYDHFEEPGCWELDEAAPAALDHCAKRGLKIGLLSNFDSRLRRILTDLDIFHRFEHVVLSGEVRASKPDRKIFEAMQGNLRVSDPESILHIGDDSTADIKGAKQAGFRHFHIQKHQPLAALSLELAKLGTD